MKIKNVYTGEELANVLKEVVATKQPTTILFHEDLFGFDDEEILIDVEYDNDMYYVTTEGSTRTMSSDYTFKDYVWAVCGW